MQHRSVFFISDGTGITAQSLGHLLAHFPDVTFRHIRLPYTNSVAKAEAALERVARVGKEDNARPIIVMTLVNPELRALICQADALCLDLFGKFIDPLALELGVEPERNVGMSHAVNNNAYAERIDAINFALNHDDGITDHGLNQARVILIGVSRCGKTPTSLYLAMQFGLKVANYPLIPEDFERDVLPEALLQHTDKLFGLTINPERLHRVRSERRPGSVYASLENCRHEVEMAEKLMQRLNVNWIDSTSRSIEEIATRVLQNINGER